MSLLQSAILQVSLENFFFTYLDLSVFLLHLLLRLEGFSLIDQVGFPSQFFTGFGRFFLFTSLSIEKRFFQLFLVSDTQC